MRRKSLAGVRGTRIAMSARMDLSSLATLSDPDLLALLHRVYSRSRESNADVIRVLMAVDERRLHLTSAFPSLFEFCVGTLRMSNASAQRFSVAARLAARIPGLVDRIQRGEVHLSALVQMRHYLSETNAESLLERTRGKNRFEIDEVLASIAPRPDAPSRMRKMPTPRTDQSVAPALPAEHALEALAPERYRVQFNASRQTRDAILRGRDLMRHSNPSGDLEKLFEYFVRVGVEQLETRQRALLRGNRRPPRDRPQTKEKREIPRPVRRAVFARDGAQCTFHDETGRRCPAKTLLQLDHVDLYARGGLHSPANLRVRCAAHNRLHAEMILGKAFVEERIAARQRQKNPEPLPKAQRSTSPAPAAKKKTQVARGKLTRKRKEPRSPKVRGSVDGDGISR